MRICLNYFYFIILISFFLLFPPISLWFPKLGLPYRDNVLQIKFNVAMNEVIVNGFFSRIVCCALQQNLIY